MKFLLLCLIFSVSVHAHEGHHKDDKTNPLLGESIYNLKSEWTTQDGKTIKLSDLRGKPLILAMTYTSCENACPLIIEDMKKIEKVITAKSPHSISFAIFSFDSSRDTPLKLKQYAEKRKLDMLDWSLYHGSVKAVRELSAVLGISYKKDIKGDFDHSNVITLLNSEGLIKFQQIGLKQDPTDLLRYAIPL